MKACRPTTRSSCPIQHGSQPTAFVDSRASRVICRHKAVAIYHWQTGKGHKPPRQSFVKACRHTSRSPCRCCSCDTAQNARPFRLRVVPSNFSRDPVLPSYSARPTSFGRLESKRQVLESLSGVRHQGRYIFFEAA